MNTNTDRYNLQAGFSTLIFMALSLSGAAGSWWLVQKASEPLKKVSDAQKLCVQEGGTNTWEPYGSNSIWTPGGWCSNLPPQGKTALENLIPELYIP